jgi:hypothetical protein
MFGIIRHQGNANKSAMRTTSHSTKMDCNQRDVQQQGLVKDMKKLDPLHILVENSIATVENRWAAPQKLKTKLPYESIIPLLGNIPKRTENTCSHKILYSSIIAKAAKE